MATTVADPVLIDTIILIDSTAVRSPWHGAARAALVVTFHVNEVDQVVRVTGVSRYGR